MGKTTVHLKDNSPKVIDTLCKELGIKTRADFMEKLLQEGNLSNLRAILGGRQLAEIAHEPDPLLALVERSGSLPVRAGDDPYRFDPWLRGASAAVLMGTSLLGAFEHREDMWATLLGDGVRLTVVIQGEPENIWCTEVAARVKRRTAATLVSLKRISETAAPEQLQVFLVASRIPYSAVLIYREGSVVDGQIAPYAPSSTSESGFRFVFQTRPDSSTWLTISKRVGQFLEGQSPIDLTVTPSDIPEPPRV